MRLCSLVLLTFVVVIGCNATGLQSKSTSCVGRCGENDGTTGCQCNTACATHGDCCSDYESVCMSCNGRCGESYVDSDPCHCNDKCAQYNNCCPDYSQLCDGSTEVTNDDILALTEELGSLDSNNLAADIVIDMQGQTSSGANDDVAPNPLFTSVPEFTADTIVLFEALRDNYEHSEKIVEDNTAAEQAEVAAFLDAVMATPVMAKLDQFMTEKQILTGTLRANIEVIWFTLYSRYASILGSSGFEHSFIGELDNSKVTGFHSWISFYREEQAGNADYKGYIDFADLGTNGYLYADRFTWYDSKKPKGSYLIGTSPEYELAIYTLCFFTRPNSKCNVQTNGVKFRIQTYELASGGLTLVGSAYPLIN